MMTGLLMTGLFDFVSYAIGLSGTPWRRFAPALILSVVISDPLLVALGAGILEGESHLRLCNPWNLWPGDHQIDHAAVTKERHRLMQSTGLAKQHPSHIHPYSPQVTIITRR